MSTQYNGWPTPADTDFVKDGAAAIRDLGDAADLSVPPVGAVLMFSGDPATLPPTWALCDGNAGTPDLRDRFVVGAGSTYTEGDTGGAAEVALGVTNLPAHTHARGTLTTASAGGHTHIGPARRPSPSGTHGHDLFVSGLAAPPTNHSASSDAPSTESGGSHTHTVNGSTASTGNGTAHENRPPYYALAFIMRIA